MNITYTTTTPITQTSPADTLAAQVYKLIIADEKVKAIKLVFDVTGAGLSACHKFITEMYTQVQDYEIDGTEATNMIEGALIGMCLVVSHPKPANG